MTDLPLWVQLLTIFMCVIVPVLILALGISQLRKTQRFMGNAQRVMGTVTDVKESRSYENTIETVTYQPTFSFQTSDGVTHSASTQVASTNRNFPIGSQQQILVNPDMLDQVRMPGFWVWGFSVIIIVFGLVFGTFGLFFLLAP